MKNHAKELTTCSGIAILFVLIIHATAYYFIYGLNQTTYIDMYKNMGIINKMIRAIVDVCVPMFIFIAGIKYGINQDNKNYIKDRFNKIISPFIIVSLFSISIKIIKDIVMGNNFLDETFIFFKLFLNIFIGINIAYQLWYIPLYLFIIFTYPILHRITTKFRITILAILALSGSVIVYSQAVMHIDYKIPLYFVYYFYLYELGIYCANNKISSNIYRLSFVIFTILLLLIINATNFSQYALLKQTIIPFCVIVFYKFSQLLKDNQLLQFLGKHSFAIFLFHEPIIMQLTAKILKHYDLIKNFYSVIILVLIPIIPSILCYKLLDIILKTLKHKAELKLYPSKETPTL